MDLETLEALAFGEDRSAALASLVAGSAEHDYWSCVLLQQRGAIDEAGAKIQRFAEAHPHEHAMRDRLAVRQLLLRAGRDLASARDELVRETGAYLHHQPASADVRASLPSRLDPSLIDERRLLDLAIEQGRGGRSSLTRWAIDALLPRWRELDPAQRAALLGAIEATPGAALVELFADVLASQGAASFANHAARDRLDLAQLESLADRAPELQSNEAWVRAVLARLVPGAHEDRESHEVVSAWADRVLAFVRKLGPVFNSLRAWALAWRLDVDRRRSVIERGVFFEYLSLPRRGQSDWAVDRSREVATGHLADPWRAAFDGLLPDVFENALVTALVRTLVAEGRLDDELASMLARPWLETQRARVMLCSRSPGDEDAQRRYNTTLGAAAVAALRQEVRIEFGPENPTVFHAHDAVVLSVELKNVPELTIKVFALDMVAYFASRGADLEPTLDLDGMVARHERTVRYDVGPMLAHQERLALPECDGPGTYIVELVGNGRSSRAIVRKGSLRTLVQRSVAGPVVYAYDEGGALLRDARVWLEGREFSAERGPRDDGGVLLPFPESQTTRTLLVVAGGRSSVASVWLDSERYELGLDSWIERESLCAHTRARILVRALLRCSGCDASVTLLDEPVIELRATRADGVESTRAEPVALSDDRETVIELRVPEDTVGLTVTLRASLRSLEGRTVDFTSATRVNLNEWLATGHCEGAFFARTSEGYSIELLGRTGEPFSERALHVQLWHRAHPHSIDASLQTDANGRVFLGPLEGVSSIAVTTPSGARFEHALATSASGRLPEVIEVEEGQRIELPFDCVGDVRSLVELRRSAPFVDRTSCARVEDRALVIEGLGLGSHRLRGALGPSIEITVYPRRASATDALATPNATSRRPTKLPSFVRSLRVDRETLVATIANGSRRTRVHVVATRFCHGPLASPSLADTTDARSTASNSALKSVFLSNRELGDEYRYVLDRRRAPRRAGVFVEKPSLLSSPWARRSTTTERERLEEGAMYESVAAPKPAVRAQAMAKVGSADDKPEPREAALGPSFDFLAEGALLLEDLRPDASSTVTIALDRLGDRRTVSLVVVDDRATDRAQLGLDDRAAVYRDLRLRNAIAPEAHVAERREVRAARAGESLDVEDARSSKLELADSVARVWNLLGALSPSATPAHFAFVPTWNVLDDRKKRALYSEHACHELELFLSRKDPEFFERVVRPHLEHKRYKRFVDHALLGDDLTPWLAVDRFVRLNAIEMALLARAVPSARAAVASWLSDRVELAPVDLESDRRSIDALLGSNALVDTPYQAAAASEAVYDVYEEASYGGEDRRRMSKEERDEPRSKGDRANDGGDGDGYGSHRRLRRESPRAYRGVDKTQEWAESRWSRVEARAEGPELAPPNRFWAAFAAHGEGPFLSSFVFDCAASALQALCAVAVLDVPFSAAAHETRVDPSDPARFTQVLASDALVGQSKLARVEPAPESAILVGQRYLRTDDRYEYDRGTPREKYVRGPFLVATPYTTRVVVTNTSPESRTLSVLAQIPRGAIALAGGFVTRTITVHLAPYATHAFEYGFYFPREGEFGHFPAHVSSDDRIVAFAEPAAVVVRRSAESTDESSWFALAQRGSTEAVASALARENLARIDLSLVAHRLRDARAFEAIVSVLESRHHYDDTLWAYALVHGDARRARAWLARRDALIDRAGPALDGAIVPIDAMERRAYEHLEYAPLINSRAHSLGARRVVLNSGLDAQYRTFLELVAHRSAASPDDLLSFAHYLFAQERTDDALAALARVREPPSRPTVDYLFAYGALCEGRLEDARRLAARWLEYPVDRWRERFAALVAMIDDAPVESASDTTQRAPSMAALGETTPLIELAVEGSKVFLQHRNVRAVSVRAHRMDVELLFSRAPFVQGDTDRFAWVSPAHNEKVTLTGDGRTELRLPAAIAGENLVIEARADGLRRSVARYAHDLAVEVAEAFGQLRVLRASTQRALPAAYVKVFARHRDGSVAFYKDGYCDARGRFDYATVSSSDLDTATRFSILVISDQRSDGPPAGTLVLEAAPPAK